MLCILVFRPILLLACQKPKSEDAVPHTGLLEAAHHSCQESTCLCIAKHAGKIFRGTHSPSPHSCSIGPFCSAPTILPPQGLRCPPLTVSIKHCLSSAFPTLHTSPDTLRFSARSLAMAWSTLACFRLLTTTWAPSWASRRAIAKPILARRKTDANK